MIILDGGMSRELIRLKAPFRQPEWSALALIETPDLVRQVHLDFATAGADIVTTNSYALVPFHLGQTRFDEEGEKLADLSGRLAREAVDEASVGSKKSVAGSLPPVFGSYEPKKFDPSRVQDLLAPFVRGLTPHIDVWLGETMSLIAEAEAVLTATASTNKPVWIAFTLEDDDEFCPQDLPRIRSGESVVDAARWAFKAGIQALLFNCSRPEVMNAAVLVTRTLFSSLEIQGKQKAPLIGVYANAFVPRAASQKANADITEIREDMGTSKCVSFGHQWVASGVDILGGCCGIGHEAIGELAETFGDKL